MRSTEGRAAPTESDVSIAMSLSIFGVANGVVRVAVLGIDWEDEICV